jgi:hypothetical protein
MRSFKIIFSVCLFSFCSFTLAPFALAQNEVQKALRVAIFFEPGFPFYNATPFTSPRAIAQNLKAIGFEADLLDVEALSGSRFNVARYDALILPYGNTFPQAAFKNLQAFHHNRGALILSGIPFTHPVANFSAAGWKANPGWGENVRLTRMVYSGLRALEIKGRYERAGADSSRLKAKGGDQFHIEAWSQNVTGSAGRDELYIRFYDDSGVFINQEGLRIPPGDMWQKIEAKITAPPNTASWDVSPQIRSVNRVVRLDDIKVSVNGTPAPLINGDFEKFGSEWSDLGHADEPGGNGPNGIEAGSFAGPGKEKKPVQIAPDDPLNLASLNIEWPPDTPQWLNVNSLPQGVKVTPALTWQGQPLAALLQFPSGAVTVWTNHPANAEAGFVANQILLRSTIAALAAQKKIPSAKTLFARLDALPKPVRYRNIKLPTPRRPYATYQPKMPLPAKQMFFVDVRKLSFDEKVLLSSLQGIINRKQPRIYLQFSEDDTFWLREMQQRLQTSAVVEVVNPLELIAEFRREIRGAVVADPNIYASACVAASLAGADSFVMATPELAAQLKLPIRADLRGKFKDNAEALRYIRTQVFPRLNPYLSICLDPAIYDNGTLDQIIAARGAAFWITGHRAQDKPGADTSAELEEIKALFAKMPLHSVVRGFWWHGDGMGIDETPGVSLSSQFGKVTIVSDLLPNLSVFSGVPLQNLKQKQQAPPPVLQKDKIYIAITMSDGDNLVTWRRYFRDYFNDPLHGTFPVGWGMAPTLIDVAPTWAQWYYDKATPNDEFICDVSGVGYIYPPDWVTTLNKSNRQKAWISFYDWTQNYMERMDMKALRLMNVADEDIAHVGKITPRVKFLMPDYGWRDEHTYAELTYTLPTGQPVFRAISYDGSPAKMANDIRTRIGTTRPAFANVFIWNWGSKMKDLKQMLDLLGPDYVAVTPSQLKALYEQSKQ